MFNHVKLDREVPKLTQLNEDGVRHYVTPEGNKYPSITTVLSEYSRQGIMEWRKRVGNEEANRVSGKASTRGTKLHKDVLRLPVYSDEGIHLGSLAKRLEDAINVMHPEPMFK